MKIRTQIIALTMVILLLAMTVTVTLVIHAIRKQGRDDMEEYRATEMAKVTAKLKNLVDAAYTTVECNYDNVRCNEFRINQPLVYRHTNNPLVPRNGQDAVTGER